MFIGHFALGYAAKQWAPRLSLAVLFAAAIFADLLWPVLVALGIEHVRIVPGITAATPLEFISYPYSHSLLTLTLLGALFAWLAVRCAPVAPVAPNAPNAPNAPVAPNAPNASVAPNNRALLIIVLLLVVSHWVLDVVTHIPDMPLYPNGPKFGLGLWNSVPGTLAVETVLFAIGVWMYARATTACDATGKWAFVGVTSFLFVGFVVNANGTPPPSVTALWMMALGLGALTLWLAWFADRHRTART
jgi:LexA-binding, inner membrane-associated putative hydrolase